MTLNWVLSWSASELQNAEKIILCFTLARVWCERHLSHTPLIKEVGSKTFSKATLGYVFWVSVTLDYFNSEKLTYSNNYQRQPKWLTE